ncbi:hypothetical protein MO973_33310 [Paenibacillus sp. TRM 82003]|nr:hypothetical protein [Paenibacillus sp. TRM 82003]
MRHGLRRFVPFIGPLFVLLLFASFWAWWGRYFPPRTNVSIIIAFVPLLLLSGLGIIFHGKRIRWNAAIACVLLLEAAFFFLRPYYVDYQVGVREPKLEAYLETAYPGERWTIESSDRSPYNFFVVFENEPEIAYHYRVDGRGEVLRIGFAGSKPGEYLHMR